MYPMWLSWYDAALAVNADYNVCKKKNEEMLKRNSDTTHLSGLLLQGVWPLAITVIDIWVVTINIHRAAKQRMRSSSIGEGRRIAVPFRTPGKTGGKM